jgi:hypothetical protein
VKRATPKPPQRYETDLPLGDFVGVNTFGPHSSIADRELRSIANYDIYPGYLKSRRGSTNLQSTGQKFGSLDVMNAVTWAIDGNEYEIRQVLNGSNTEFWWAKILPTTTAHARVADLAAVNVSTSSDALADMKVSGNKLFVFHPDQNYIIEWSGSAFVARTMGLPQIFLTSLAATGSSSLSGKFTVGVELVYQVGGVDIVAGSPCRKTSGLKRLDITVTNQNILVQLDSTSFPSGGDPGDYWTHVRVWRSLNQNVDLTDPLNPVDAQGLPDELYPEQLITKSALVTAGYQVTLTKLESELPSDTTSEYQFLDIKGIELQPLPASYTGAYHRNRIWVSRSQGVNDSSQSTIFYSQSAGDAYSEQYDPLNALKAERGDGQETVKLMTLESDLIVLKQAKTLRVPGGDVDAGLEVLDSSIGIGHLKLAGFVPKVGICAITNDQGDFRILGYDLRWSNIFAEFDISRPLRTETAAMAADPDFVSFGYVNGKLLISDGTGTVYAFNAKEGRAWGVYSYPMNDYCQMLLPFSNGSRCLVSSRSTYIVEIEKDDLDTDINTASDVESAIALSMTLPRYQSNNGRDVIEMQYLSVIGQLSVNLNGVPFANGYPWPAKTEETITPFVPDVGAYSEGDLELEREYRLYIESRMLANFPHFKITTYAPATIRDIRLHCFVDEIGMGNGYFDPFIALSSAHVTPDWIDTEIIDGINGPRNLSDMDTYDGVNGTRDVSTMEILEGSR